MFVIVQAWNNLPLDFVKNRGVPEAIGIALQHAVSSIPGRFSNKYVLAKLALEHIPPYLLLLTVSTRP